MTNDWCLWRSSDLKHSLVFEIDLRSAVES